ncbi:hypothetical protein [Glaciecola sp. KUL10]|uniref:hypothetical protein n=1 Tax=Glaciecola sp. (strain KUL10) TaxID=2161813 RepID=UPI000D785EA5|nr:hypothetical protein [Glaciecola sp. KUL10]GBL06324.1 hypothetical protein KUL10_36650 [Glaciecola sp. KUL10]
MRLNLLCLGFISHLIGCTTTVDYPITYAQIYQENNKLESIELYDDTGKNFQAFELYDSAYTDIFIYDNLDKVSNIENTILSEKVELRKCEGYKKLCFEVDNFKMMLPDNFDFENSMTWTWDDYVYESISKRIFSVFGTQFEAIEIIGIKSEEPKQLVHFFVSKERGLLYFIIRFNDYRSAYVLSSKNGLWKD